MKSLITFAYVAIILAIVIAVYRKLKYSQVFKYSDIDKDADSDGIEDVIDKEKSKEFATSLRTFITSTNVLFGRDLTPMTNLRLLNDKELKYAGRYYRNMYGESMSTDIDNEYLPFTDEDEKIIARLIKLGE